MIFKVLIQAPWRAFEAAADMSCAVAGPPTNSRPVRVRAPNANRVMGAAQGEEYRRTTGLHALNRTARSIHGEPTRAIAPSQAPAETPRPRATLGRSLGRLSLRAVLRFGPTTPMLIGARWLRSIRRRSGGKPTTGSIVPLWACASVLPAHPTNVRESHCPWCPSALRWVSDGPGGGSPGPRIPVPTRPCRARA